MLLLLFCCCRLGFQFFVVEKSDSHAQIPEPDPEPEPQRTGLEEDPNPTRGEQLTERRKGGVRSN